MFYFFIYISIYINRFFYNDFYFFFNDLFNFLFNNSLYRVIYILLYDHVLNYSILNWFFNYNFIWFLNYDLFNDRFFNHHVKSFFMNVFLKDSFFLIDRYLIIMWFSAINMWPSDLFSNISLDYRLLSIFTNYMRVSYTLSILSLIYNSPLSLFNRGLRSNNIRSSSKHMRTSDLTLDLTLLLLLLL